MSRKKILIVDDSAVIVKTLSMKLTANGYDVVTAEDGASAVSAIRRENPDLLLLDISFPPDVAHGGGVPWDGFLIMEWLRRLEETKGIPVFIITGTDTEKFKTRALALGATNFFPKPVDSNQLLEAIHRATADKTGQSAPGGKSSTSGALPPLRMSKA